ncbi:MAG TPA: hypothetical protein VMU84_15825 [Thermoanaerobaculia bacterium]|nr:hypothetical protein [Thermoanaerobaculia bacterium]
MSEFVTATLSDLRGGRQSWRVVATMSVPAFVLALVVAFVRQPF